MTICRQCGTRNPDDAAYCASCGAPLHDEQDEQPTIIDVSSVGPEVVDTEPRGRWFGEQYIGQGRIYVAQGGNRTCVIVVVVVLLAICCVCIGWWSVADALF